MNALAQKTYFLGLSVVVLTNLLATAGPLPQLKVSENKRFLVTADGQPFFWLGDTTWELFHRLNREQAIQLFENRAARKFNVLQSVAIAELEGHTDPNPYGHLPFIDLDVTRPALKDGPQNDYWDHVDFIVAEANKRELYIGFLPTWGRFWRDTNQGRKPLFDAEKAEVYGKWLGQRYKDSGLIWILSGDRPIENDTHKEIIRAMARGLRSGDGGKHVCTFHPPGGNGSSTWFHDDDWLDFNMRQNGHVTEFTGRYSSTRKDYDRTPIKPVSMASRSTKITRSRSKRPNWATVLVATCAARSTGIFSPARLATLTAITPSGRCGRRASSRSTTHSCRGMKPLTSPVPCKCNMAAR